MVIELNVDTLLKNKISASQYIILVLLFENKQNTLNTYFATLIEQEGISEVNDLLNRGLIISWDKNKGIDSAILNLNKAKALFGFKDSFFWELFSTYPIKVVTKRGGTRSLRPISLSAKETLDCKRKYEKYLGKRSAQSRHDHVMKCLKAELWSRGKSDNIEFMHELLTYINKQAWSKYEYLLDVANQTAKTIKYGEELI